jgi:predicted PurR-regulated permease PerM
VGGGAGVYGRRVSRERLFAAFFFVVFALLLYQLFRLLEPFAGPLVWAAILALTFYPATTWLVRAFRGNRDLAALVLVCAVLLGAILPSLFVGSLLVREAGGAYEWVQQATRDGEITRLFNEIRTSRPGMFVERALGPLQARLQLDAQSLLVSATSWVSGAIAGQAGAVAKNALLSLLNGSLMLIALFFFFRDGERMAARLRDLIPMERAHKDEIFLRLYDTLAAVVQSMVVIAVVQGVLAGFGYWIIGGMSFAVFLGFLTGVAAFIPMAGAAAVWIPATLYLLLTDHPWRALLLGGWGMVVVSMVDNLLRPLLIGGRARLPTFLLLFSILGGVSVYGFVGVFVAPVIVAALLSFVDIYRDLYVEPSIVIVDRVRPEETRIET